MNYILDGNYPKKVKNLINTYLEWSQYNKLLTNFVANIEKFLTEDNKLHASFSITFTSSGRTGVRSPALQTLPKRSKIAHYIRELFIPPSDSKIVKADYNVSELRWVGYVANDKKFKEIFANNKDPHKITSLKIQYLPEDYEYPTKQQLKEARTGSKPLNFGLIYKMQAETIKTYAKQEFGIEYTKNQAKKFFDIFMDTYKGVPIWHEKDTKFLYKHGYLRTSYGRKLILPNIYSEDKYKRLEAERTGINGRIQGPSSDSTLLAGYTFINDPEYNKDECQVVLFIHDEVVLSVKEDKIEKYAKLLQKHMENVPTEWFGFSMDVPLKIEAEAGENLADTKKLEYII